MRKLLLSFAVCCVTIMYGGCNPMEKSIKSIQGKDGVFAVMETTRGNIVLELYYKDTPLTAVNFVGLAEGTLDAAKGKPFYDGLTFHRVISKGNGDDQDFMIQGGDPRGNGTGGPGYSFADEINFLSRLFRRRGSPESTRFSAKCWKGRISSIKQNRAMLSKKL